MNENLRNTTVIDYIHYDQSGKQTTNKVFTMTDKTDEQKPQNESYSLILFLILLLGMLCLAYKNEIKQFFDDHPIPTSEVQQGTTVGGKIMNTIVIDHDFMVYSNCDLALMNENNGVIYQSGTYYIDLETEECVHIFNQNTSGGWIAKNQILN